MSIIKYTDQSGKVTQIQELLRESQGVRKEVHSYDVNGHPFSLISLHKRSFTLYDVTGKLLAEVDSNGLLTEHQYDEQGNLAVTTSFDVKLDVNLVAC